MAASASPWCWRTMRTSSSVSSAAAACTRRRTAPRHVEVDAEAQPRPAPIGRSAGGGDAAPDRVERAAGLGKQRRAGRRQRDAAAVADEELSAELGLHAADLLRQRGLGDAEPVRGRPEVELVGDRHERREESQVDVHARHRRGPDARDASPAADRVLDSAGAATHAHGVTPPTPRRRTWDPSTCTSS
jgi:hypothetical protein